MFTCGYGIYKFILFLDMSANVSVLRPQKYVRGCQYGNRISFQERRRQSHLKHADTKIYGALNSQLLSSNILLSSYNLMACKGD